MIRLEVLTNYNSNLQLHVLDRGDYVELLTSDEKFVSGDKVPFRRWYHNKVTQWVLYKGKKYFK